MLYCCLQFGWDGGGADELGSFLRWKSGVRHMALPVILWNTAIDLEGDLFSRPFFLYCYIKIQFLCTFSGVVLALAELQLQRAIFYTSFVLCLSVKLTYQKAFQVSFMFDM